MVPEIDPELADHLFGHASEDEEATPPPEKKRTNGIRVAVADSRPEVKTGTDIHRVVDEAAAAIVSDPRLFSRAHELVTVVGAPAPDEHERAPFALGTPIIKPLGTATMVERLTKHVRFVRKANPKKDVVAAILGDESEVDEIAGAKWQEVLPPGVVVQALLARGEWQGSRTLVGVTETPILRPDGTIRQDRGYDASTGYLYLPSCAYPHIPEDPTQDDAKRALERLQYVFADFPYVSEAHRLVPIAAILTVMARPAIRGSIPLFLFDASTRGSGKSLQADVVSAISVGRSAARKTYPEDDEELDKVLGAYAMAGARIVLLDNIKRPVEAGPLEAYITARDDVEARVLGRSSLVRCPWYAVMMLSGNNLMLGEDMIRRVLIARLESPLENPQERADFQIEGDLFEFVRHERPKLVAAALTILRAYCAVGRPDADTGQWGSFDAWAALVPPALRFAGGANVLEARPAGERALTDDMMAMSVILRELPRLNTKEMTAKTIIDTLWPRDRDPDDRSMDGWEQMREAVTQIAAPKNGMRPQAGAFGRRLGRHEGRVLGGRRLKSRVTSGSRYYWSEEVK